MMRHSTTNFAYVMDLLELTPTDFVNADFDRTLISKWRTGARRIMPERALMRRLSDFLLETDNARPHSALSGMLRAWSPIPFTDTRSALEQFLAYKENGGEAWAPRRSILLGKDRNPTAHMNQFSVGAAQMRVLDFYKLALDNALSGNHDSQADKPGGSAFRIALPQGFGVFGSDEEYFRRVLGMMSEFDKAKLNMTFITRADFPIHRGASIWESAIRLNLNNSLNYISFNDFFNFYSDVYLMDVPGFAALRITQRDPDRPEYFTINMTTNSEEVHEIGALIDGYASRSQLHIFHNLFERPNGAARGITPRADEPCYMITRLPHLCIQPHDNIEETFKLNRKSARLIRDELTPLMTDPTQFHDSTFVRHIFCVDDISAALAQARHISRELSQLLRRRVFMEAAQLVHQLEVIRYLLVTQPGYEVCFLNGEYFARLGFQCIALGQQVAFGWQAGGNSVCHRSKTGAGMMQSVCEQRWHNIPESERAKANAIARIDQWLNEWRMGVMNA